MATIKKLSITGMRKVNKATYTFSPDNNYVFGLNGQGKSTVLNAIQLALLGYIPGQAKTTRAIMQNANGKFMEVECTLSTDSGDVSICRSWTKKGRSCSTDVSITPESFNIESLMEDIELPVFNFSELLGMSANAQKDYFINLLKDFGEDVDVAAKLRESYDSVEYSEQFKEEHRSEILDSILDDGLELLESDNYDGVEKIAKFHSYLKNRLSVETQALDRSKAALQTLVFYDDIDSTMTEESCMKKLNELNEQLNKVLNYDAQKAAYTKQMDTLAKYDDFKGIDDIANYPEWLSLQKQERSLSDDRADVRKKMEDIQASITTLDTELQQLETETDGYQKILDGKGICPYSNSECSTIVSALSDMKSKLSEVKKKIYELRVKRSQLDSELSKLRDKSCTIDAEHKSVVSAKSDILSHWSMYSNLKESLLEEPIPVTGSASNLREEISNYQDCLSRIRANKQYEELIAKVTKDKNMSELRIAVLKKFIKLTGPNGLQTDAARSSFNKIQDSLSKYLEQFFVGQDVSAEFNVTNENNSFNFGLRRGDDYIPYRILSTGEQCMYLLAFTCCLFDFIDSDLKVILMDDMLDHLDDCNAITVFESMKSISNIQFICAGVMCPPVDGINTIEITR